MFDLGLYAFVVLFTVVLMKQYNPEWEKKDRIMIILLSLSLPVFIFAFGKNIGYDRPTYYWYYEIIEGLRSYMDVGFNALILLCQALQMNFQLFCGVCCILMFACVFGALKLLHYEKYYWIGLYISFFLIYFTSFNIMRQAIAASVVLLAFACAITKKEKSALALFVLAFSFHKTAIIGMAMYALYKFIREDWSWVSFLRRHRYCYFVYALLLSGVAFFSIGVLIEVLHFMGMFGSYQVEYNFKGFAFLLYFAPKLFFYLFFIKDEDLLTHKLLLLWTLFIPSQTLGAVIPFADRISLYPSLLEIILAVRILASYERGQTYAARVALYPRYGEVSAITQAPSALQHGKKKSLYLLGILVYYVVYFMVIFYMEDANELFPYWLY